VHGRGFKPGADELFELAHSGLRAGIERDFPDAVGAFDEANCELAYYGDLTAALLESNGERYDATLDVSDRRNVLATLRKIPARKRFGIRQYDSLPGKSALNEFVADLAAPILSGVGLWMWCCQRFSTDFAEYLKAETSYATEVRSRLRDRLLLLLERGDKLAVLAHGTGSVVAWDVLWELTHSEEYRSRIADKKVDMLLTMGSPLGDATVQKRVLGAGEKGSRRYPGNILSWMNVSAEDDYTCHDKAIADDFSRMMQERLISSISDFAIYNHAVRYGKSNPHSSIGYHIHPRISKILSDWLCDDVP
jgi:hypothetical protein